MALARIYLLVYNGASFVLWAALLGHTLGGGSPGSTTAAATARAVAPPPPLLTATQTLALVEIAHAALGLVRASPAATALQVGGKNLVVWTVMVPFWDQLVYATAASPAAAAAAADASAVVARAGLAGFLGCFLTWSASEMVRFGYFAVQLARGREPFGWLKWLRYNAFLVLYPIGLLSEALLVYLALTQVTGIGTLYRAYLFLGLLTYLPAGPYLYTHMLAQRRKMLKRPAKAQ